ncbi:MAG: twin-arginine translocase TatA/TatE family subunit [Cytophagaceae bacterium]|jgi:sec-independent protein translocase protein TatA|nr:twin-arginine translocase TatA/TatE family subunit [Cytophagaceae bacterium]
MLTIGTLLFLQSLGFTEILLIVLLVVFLFGGKKIPELARGLGRGIREFKDASKEVKKEINDSLEEDKKA